uniref:Large ribosomal subunit protein bL27m n=1 Tax=Prolemur simus TaxID=1328070 RepID=A0A8C8ZPA1_PROSS
MGFSLAQAGLKFLSSSNPPTSASQSTRIRDATPTLATALAIRYSSKKTRGSSKNLSGKSSGRHYGIKKMESHYVHAGNILRTQCQFHWHPGAHIELGRRRVQHIKEAYVPNSSNSGAADLVIRLPKGTVLYKTFVHVVSAKAEGTFKLGAMR